MMNVMTKMMKKILNLTCKTLLLFLLFDMNREQLLFSYSVQKRKFKPLMKISKQTQ